MDDVFKKVKATYLQYLKDEIEAEGWLEEDTGYIDDLVKVENVPQLIDFVWNLHIDSTDALEELYEVMSIIIGLETNG